MASQRTIEIMAMVESGVARKEIAEKFGITTGRVAGIIKEVAQAKRRDEGDEFSSLSIRTRNGLRSGSYFCKADLEKDINNGNFPRRKIANFGQKCLDEVMAWLGKEVPKKKRPTCPHCGGEL